MDGIFCGIMEINKIKKFVIPSPVAKIKILARDKLREESPANAGRVWHSPKIPHFVRDDAKK